MKQVLSKLRGWVVPTLFVMVVAGLMVPVSYWVLLASYNRDITDNVNMLQRRVEGQLSRLPMQGRVPLEVLIRPMVLEMLGDQRVQAVYVFPDLSGGGLQVTRQGNASTWGLAKIKMADIDAALPADSPIVRYRLPWHFDVNTVRMELAAGTGRDPSEISDEQVKTALVQKGARPDLLRGYIYLDLSRAQMWAQFVSVSKPLMKRVIAFTGAVILVVSAIATFAYRATQKLGRVRLRAELEQQGLLAERGLTAAVLAHEIRNPLAALRFQLHSLRKNSGDVERVGKTADTIDSELSRIQQLVQDYLAHEKAQTMRLAEVDLADASRALKTLMDELLRQTETDLAIVAPERAVRVSCDPAMLRQVLMNLVLNAQQAMGNGGRITLTLGQDEAFGTIDVADTGPGIPEEMRQRLFKPFQTSKKEGSGIGLALVKRFVDNFGGAVTVDSTPGVGTTFHLRLPLASGAAMPPTVILEQPATV